MNIYLIGFMGTGKSAVGQGVARRLGRQFVDLDRYIEEKAGKTIPDIFSLAGEAFFRTLESKALAELSAKDDFVISCGGGVVTVPENINVMKRTGKVLRLTASVDAMLARCAVSGCRPLLEEGGNRKETVERLMAERAPLYEQAADMTVDTTELTVPQAIQAALDSLSEVG